MYSKIFQFFFFIYIVPRSWNLVGLCYLLLVYVWPGMNCGVCMMDEIRGIFKLITQIVCVWVCICMHMCKSSDWNEHNWGRLAVRGLHLVGIVFLVLNGYTNHTYKLNQTLNTVRNTFVTMKQYRANIIICTKHHIEIMWWSGHVGFMSICGLWSMAQAQETLYFSSFPLFPTQTTSE